MWDRIPYDIMHIVPTTLLHSLEGMAGLDWEKLLKLQCQDGSFLFSPSSTAYALMQTQDENCFRYLNKVVERFSGGGKSCPLCFHNHQFCFHFTLYTCACLPCNFAFFFCLLVPNVYPVDLFEHIWAVDRLQRLGISRYFEPEIKECINYVARYNIYTHWLWYCRLILKLWGNYAENIYMLETGHLPRNPIW